MIGGRGYTLLWQMGANVVKEEQRLGLAERQLHDRTTGMVRGEKKRDPCRTLCVEKKGGNSMGSWFP